MSQKEQSKESLLAAYTNLSGLELMVVRLIAVFYEPISRSMLAKLLVEMKCSPTGHMIAPAARISQILDPLVDKEILLMRQDKSTLYYVCPNTIGWDVVLDVEERGLIPTMEKAFKKYAPIGDMRRGGYQHNVSFERYVRELRLALLGNDYSMVNSLLMLARNEFDEYLEIIDPFAQIIDSPKHHKWFATLSPVLQWTVLSNRIDDAIERLTDLSPISELIDTQLANKNNEAFSAYRHWKVVLEILAGRIEKAEQILYGPDPVEAPLCLQGWLHTLRGDNEAAIKAFEESLGVLRKANKRRDTFLMHPSGIFFILALLSSGSSVNIKKAEKHLMWLSRQRIFFRSTYQALLVPFLVLDNQADAAKATQAMQYIEFSRMNEWDTQSLEHFIANIEPPDATDLTGLFLMLGFKWTLPELIDLMQDYLVDLKTKARSNGHVLIGEAVAALLPDGPENPLWDPTSVVVYKPQWQYALERLESQFLDDGVASKEKSISDQRLIWIIDIGKWADHLSVQPKLQKRTAKGRWSKGRNIALKRLSQEVDAMPWLTAQDLRACSSIQKVYSGWGHYGGSYEMDSNRAIQALVGHPFVFWEDTPDIPVEVVQSDPGLQVHEEGDNIRLTMNHPVSGEGIMVIKESINRCNVIQVGPEHAQLSVVLGSAGLVIPAQEKERIQRLLGPLSSRVDIQTNLSGINEHLPEILASTMPHVHLQPHDEGLMMRMLVRPFGDEGPYHAPGSGSPTLITEIKGQRQQTNRDFTAETEVAQDVVQNCPSIPIGNGDWRWNFEDPESCLELLFELREVGDRIAVLWPEGETMKVSQSMTMENLSLKTSGDNDWFHVEGEVLLPNGDVMDMKALLEAMSQRHGRFIPLGDGQFLALTRAFKKRLEALHNFAEKRGRGERYHHLMLPAINELVEGAGSLETHSGWKDRLKALEKAQSKKPRIPKTFEAELRPYQLDGFKWMFRLAAWGAGACLADDMGLGKTLQAMAMLVARASEGPALVVAPTSVCMNWMMEARRFAPTLNMLPFSSDDREKIISELKPFDVLVCSYTLLQLESERLQSVDWQTIVLDEAQAIKNPAAKRTKAALALSGKFRLVTTGTPIENHLVDLWSLFRFLNPGLLGSKESFVKRFSNPIERGDIAVKDQLKRILSPFILRRTKNQVLDDLPPKTEITLHVSLSSDEAALYEALRQRAVENLSDIDAADNQQRLNVLAEITKLRRACCHPSLVVPEQELEGAKLNLFSEVVDELRDNGHRALVFSQFVGHLAIIRKRLDEKKISYQYLDGSTPAKKRQKLVSDFQNGEGDLFLISLKAGGSGLNLTGADYVIHMDPWWNPAVEDQASDRVHRIGQKRPVTIYRLVTENTIEEKIVALHHRKRDLANNLLDGTHKIERLSTEMLLQLIRE